jgi:hypothetical protein
MRTILASAGAALLVAALAACDDGGSASTEGAKAPAQKMRIRNKTHEDIVALPDHLRRVALIRAIRETGNRCPKRVEPNPVHQGDYRGMALWTARCDDNRQWAIFVAPSGHFQVRNCEQMGRLDLPACRELPLAAPDQGTARQKAR